MTDTTTGSETRGWLPVQLSLPRSITHLLTRHGVWLRWVEVWALALIATAALAGVLASTNGDAPIQVHVREWVDHLQLHALLTHPLEGYAQTRSATLPISPLVAGASWVLGGIALWFASARPFGLLGYAGWSVATVYVVAVETPLPGAELAAALVALALLLARVYRWAALTAGIVLSVGYAAELGQTATQAFGT